MCITFLPTSKEFCVSNSCSHRTQVHITEYHMQQKHSAISLNPMCQNTSQPKNLPKPLLEPCSTQFFLTTTFLGRNSPVTIAFMQQSFQNFVSISLTPITWFSCTFHSTNIITWLLLLTHCMIAILHYKHISTRRTKQ